MSNGMTESNITLKCATELSDLIRNSFKTILTQIAEFSPSDSMVNAQLRMNEGLYKAQVEIHSAELNISTEKCADNVVSLLGTLKHDLMDQIEAWKKVRTVEPHSA